MKRISKWSFLVDNSSQRFFCFDANISLAFEKLADIIFLEQNGFNLGVFQNPLIAFCAIYNELKVVAMRNRTRMLDDFRFV